MEHVEFCHPENEDPPFHVRENEGMSRLAGGHNEEAASASDFPSQDDEYFECDCGEIVMLPEMNSHLILHESEETTVDKAVPAAILSSDDSIPLNNEVVSLALIANTGIHPSKLKIGSKSHVKRRSRPPSHKSQHGVKDFVGVLLGSDSLSSHSKSARAKYKAPRRLGVRRFSIQVVSRANGATEI